MRQHLLSALRAIAPFIYRAFPMVRNLRYRVADGPYGRFLARPYKLKRPRSDPQDLHRVISEEEMNAVSGVLAFPSVDGAEVSVIIPVYNQVLYTLTCLRSLASHASKHAFEVIIIDDGSSDRTAELLPIVENLNYIRNVKNLGFLRSCNRAAERAQGKRLVFLNNDVNLFPDWLDALVETFEQHDKVGIVGSKLIFGDCTLQEAGGIIWADGTGANYGRGGHPDDPRYNFVRDVDYVSGASLMIDRALFERLGGFDERYIPAYYEDTDLCFRVREAGCRVIYQPRSVLIHYEGATSGRSEDEGVKRHQAVNRMVFADRWKDVLQRHGQPGQNIDVAADRRSRDHVLVIDHRTPMPDQDSGSVDMINILRILVEERLRVHFFALYDHRYADAYTKALQDLGVECADPAFNPTLRSYVELLKRSISQVIISRETVASRILRDIQTWLPDARILFHTVDLHFLRQRRVADLSGSAAARQRADLIERSELELIGLADATIVISEFEKALLEGKGFRNIHLLPLIREIPGAGPADFAEREGVLFFGGFEHMPNVDAVDFLLSAIWPAVRGLRSDAGASPIPLIIAGSNMPTRLLASGAKDVFPIGYVEDPAALFNSVRYSVAPLRYGAGLKGKVASSMAHGVPAICTNLALEGFPAGGSAGVFFKAEDADDLAKLISDLYDNVAVWNIAAQRSVAYADRHFSIEAARKKLKSIMRQS